MVLSRLVLVFLPFFGWRLGALPYPLGWPVFDLLFKAWCNVWVDLVCVGLAGVFEVLFIFAEALLGSQKAFTWVALRSFDFLAGAWSARLFYFRRDEVGV